MTPEQMDRLFQAFTQADASTTAQYGGTGLGLAITRHSARCSAATSRSTSEVGKGSVFTMTLPDRAARDGRELRRAPPEVAATAPKVLVVDDDAAAREILDRDAAQGGLSCRRAAAGEKRSPWRARSQPDAITLDVHDAADGWLVGAHRAQIRSRARRHPGDHRHHARTIAALRCRSAPPIS